MDTKQKKLDNEMKNHNILNDKRKNLRNKHDVAFVKFGKLLNLLY